MNILNLWKRVKPFLFSNSTIFLLRRSRNSDVQYIESCADIKRIKFYDSIEDILMAEPDQDISIYHDLFIKDNLIFYAYINGEYVARCLVDISNVELSYLRAWNMVLPEDSAYIHRLYTSPEVRGKHIAQKLISTICDHLYNKDIYTLVLKTKPNSLKAFYNNGFVAIKSVHIIYFFFIPIVRVKDL